MTKFFFLLFCFPYPLRELSIVACSRRTSTTGCCPQMQPQRLWARALPKPPVVRRTGHLPYIHFSSLLLFTQDKIYLEMVRHNELNSGFATPMFIMGSLYRFRRCPRNYMARYNYPSSSCPFLDQKMARASSSTITVLF